MTLPAGIHYVSPLPGTGYGDSAEQYIAGLRDRIPITWTPSETDPAKLARSIHQDIRDLSITYDTVMLHLPPWEFRRWLNPAPGRVQIGMIAWETDFAPADWCEVLDELDLILVCSNFVKAALTRTGTRTPIDVLPHIARQVRPDPSGQFGNITDEDFVFYVIGDWYNRKAIPDSIRTFLDTFTADDDVALILKTSAIDYGALETLRSTDSPPETSQTVTAWWSLAHLIREYPSPPKLFMYAGNAPSKMIDQIHTRGDCYVSLDAGEGWGLCSFDAGSFGNPSIVTGWGGHLDYLGSDYPLLVDYELVPTATSEFDAYGFPLSEHSKWARANRSHASALMRQVYENPGEAARLGADVRGKLAGRFTPDVITSRLVALIANAHDRQSTRRS